MADTPKNTTLCTIVLVDGYSETNEIYDGFIEENVAVQHMNIDGKSVTLMRPLHRIDTISLEEIE